MRSSSIQVLKAAGLPAALGVLAFALGACGGGGVEDVSRTLNQPGVDQMSSGGSTVVGVIVLLLVPILTWAWLNNGLVSKEESTYAAWAQVESSYQRRNDLIPGLVESVSRYLKHESDTLQKVVRERNAGPEALAKAVAELAEAQRSSAAEMAALGGRPPADEARTRELAQADARVGAGVQRVMALAEAYPELRSADQFLELQAQLEGTENRINVARLQFNDAVRSYNESIRKIPGSLVAGAKGMQRKAYFQSDESAREAKSLDFH